MTLLIYGINVSRAKHWIEPSGVIIGHDYFAFYMAGDMVRNGKTDHLYNVLAQQDYQQNFMKSINPRWTGTCLYLNPPHYAWLMSFLARWNYGPSFLVWMGISLGCFAGTALLWRKWFKREHFSLIVTLAICMPAFFQALAGGQNSFFSLLILTGFCSLLIAGRDFWAGLVLAFLAFKFQFLVIPVIVLMAKRRWRVLAGVTLGALFTLFVTYLCLGPQVLWDYWAFGANLGHLMQNKGFDAFKQHSWHGFFQLIGSGWLAPMGIRILTGVFSLGTLALLVPIFRKPWDIKSPDFSIQLSALLVAMLITSPHLFHYDMLLLTLPAVLWFRAYHLDPMPQFDEPVKALLAMEFVWLLVCAPAVQHFHLQLTPILMVLVLIALVYRSMALRLENSPIEIPSLTNSPFLQK